MVAIPIIHVRPSRSDLIREAKDDIIGDDANVVIFDFVVAVVPVAVAVD